MEGKHSQKILFLSKRKHSDRIEAKFLKSKMAFGWIWRNFCSSMHAGVLLLSECRFSFFIKKQVHFRFSATHKKLHSAINEKLFLFVDVHCIDGALENYLIHTKMKIKLSFPILYCWQNLRLIQRSRHSNRKTQQKILKIKLHMRCLCYLFIKSYSFV